MSDAPVRARVEKKDLALWRTAEQRRRLLKRMGEILAARGLDLIAVKGIHLAFVFAHEPWYRPMDDADAWVPRGGYHRAVAILRAEGRFVVEAARASASVSLAELPDVRVDLNRWLLPPFFGAIPEAQLSARAWRKTALGPEVLVPDPVDAAALVVAHFAKDGVPAERVERARLDLELLREKAGVTPEALARRLDEWRLKRRGLVALSALVDSDRRFDGWLDAARGGPLERAIAGFSAPRLSRVASRAPGFAGSIVAAFGDSLTNSVLSFGFASLRAARSFSMRLFHSVVHWP